MAEHDDAPFARLRRGNDGRERFAILARDDNEGVCAEDRELAGRAGRVDFGNAGGEGGEGGFSGAQRSCEDGGQPEQHGEKQVAHEKA